MYSWDYTSDTSFAAKRREEYQARMIDYIKGLGINTNLTQIASDVKDVLNFEIKLAKVGTYIIEMYCGVFKS